MNNNLTLRWCVVACSVLAASVSVLRAADDSKNAAKPVSFYKEVRPILQANCQGCHQPAKAKGNYVMTEFQKLFIPGETGDKPIVPGKPEESPFLKQITPTNGEAEMPKGKPPLHNIEIDLVKRWIAEGAADDTPPNAIEHYDAEHPPVYVRQPIITALDFAPDGSLIAVAGFHEVLLHKADGSGIAGRLIGLSERIQSVRFSADGKLLAAAGGRPGRMGEVQIWDVEKRILKVSVPVGFDTVYGVNWSPDGKLVSFGCPDKTVRAIDAATGKQVLQQMAHDDWVLDTVFSTNGTYVVSVGRDMTTKLTEVPTQRFVDNITSITPGALRGGLQSVARHPTKDEVLVGGSDGRPQIFQMFRQAARKIGDNATLLRKFSEMDGRIFSVEYSPNGKVIACAAALDGRGSVNLYASDFDSTIPEVILKAYEKTSGEYTKEQREAIEKFTTDGVKLLHRIELPAAVYTVSFSPDGQLVAAAGGNGMILMINVESGAIERSFAVAPIREVIEPTAKISTQETKITSAESVRPDSPLKNGNIIGLTVHPKKVSLAKRNDHVQLLVTAQLPSGDTMDVTRHAKFEVSDGLGTVSPLGYFTALKRGEGAVQISFAGRSVQVSLDLANFEDAFQADFVRDVSPVLARVGCNAGTCHGSKEGKNGFKLSLRGYDPIFDVRAFADDLASRRVNLASPDESLLLLKATGAVPHEGGQRIRGDSEYYAILRKWIADGAQLHTSSARVARIEVFPKDPIVQEIGVKQQMRVVGTYSDGYTRDVTAEAFIESGNTDVASTDGGGLINTLRRGEAPLLARYEGNYAATTLTVMSDRSGFVWKEPPANNRIDELVAAKWKRMKILPSDLCTDAEFIRRASLDLIGLPPTADEVEDFLKNPRSSRNKRDATIERLLNSPEFADHWTQKWADLLQVNRKFLGVEGAELFRNWIRQQIVENRPYDQFVRTILTTSGSNKENPPASYWKILREPTAAMENTTHLFLATRFNCNKCHDHPFERWTQDEYYNLSQYFAQVTFKKDEASGDRKIGGSAVEGATPLYEIVVDSPEGSVKHDRTGKVVPAKFPFKVDYEAGTNTTRRAELSKWLTSPDNRYFALSYVNRLWGYLMGVGLIEPLDDIRAGNPPSNPELLEHLTREFIESGFNTRHIIRQICQSRTYQLSLSTHEWNGDDKVNFSHALARRLPAEVLLDSVYRVTGSTPDFPGAKPGVRAAQLIDSAIDLPSGFLANLGRPPRESACECERSNDIKLSSVMSLLSGPAVSDAVNDPDNAISRLARMDLDDRNLADRIFLRVLNRHATEAEIKAVTRFETELEKEHQRLTQAYAEAKTSWSQRKIELEHARTAEIQKAEKALVDYLVERAPKLAAEKRGRDERIGTAEADIREYEPELATRLKDWESTLTTNHFETFWVPLSPVDLNSSGSVRLKKLPDGSVRSTASVGEMPTYTITAETMLTNITGVKLEVLPDAELPHFGPGHGDGDFVLSEFEVEYATKTNATKFAKAKISSGIANYNVKGQELSQTWNGVTEQGRREGWSIGKETGRPHWATFALEKPVGDTNGTILKFVLSHRYEAPHEIGRFRIWITTNATPISEGLPLELADELKTSAKRRNEQQVAKLTAHIRSRDPEMLKRDFKLELARKPLPEDTRLKDLEIELSRAAKPVPVDPRLAQLQHDLELSTEQLTKKRLTAAQDLTWALINTPSFLFNH